MSKYSFLKTVIIVYFAIYSQVQAQNSAQQASQFSLSLEQLRQNLDLLKSQAHSIYNNTQITNEFTSILNDIIKNIMDISIQIDGSIMDEIGGIFGSNDQTEDAFNSLKQSQIELTKQINSAFVEILNKINLIIKNSSIRNIDSSVTLLLNLIETYSQNSPDDYWIYQQICGDYLNTCNQAFIFLANSLSNYISEAIITNQQNSTDILTQYVIYNSLLISSIPCLIDLNTRVVIYEEKLDRNNLTSIQIKQFSLQTSILDSYQKNNEIIYSVVPELYEIYYYNITIQKNSYIELAPQNKSLIKGIQINGESVQSFNQTQVCKKGLFPSEYLINQVIAKLDVNEAWVNCTNNSFLRGFLLGDDFNIYNIDELVCNAYQNIYWKECHGVNTADLTASNQWAMCDENSFIAGFYKGVGNHITQLNCCSITSQRPVELSQLDGLIVSKISYNIALPQGIVNFTAGLVQFFTIPSNFFEGQFEVGVRNDVLPIQPSSTDVNFQTPFSFGNCTQDYFLSGYTQGGGNLFSDIKAFGCTMYDKVYWKSCTVKVIPSYENYWKCLDGSCQTPKNIPKIVGCPNGSYLIGFSRNSLDNLNGLERIHCCSITDQPGQYLQ